MGHFRGKKVSIIWQVREAAEREGCPPDLREKAALRLGERQEAELSVAWGRGPNQDQPAHSTGPQGKCEHQGPPDIGAAGQPAARSASLCGRPESLYHRGVFFAKHGCQQLQTLLPITSVTKEAKRFPLAPDPGPVRVTSPSLKPVVSPGPAAKMSAIFQPVISYSH